MGTIPASENVFDHIRIAEAAAPSTPASGTGIVYYKSDGKLYWKDDAGTEHAVGEGDVAAHLADASDAHDASAISILDTGNHFTATDVEAALAELATSGGATTLDDLTDVSTSGAATDDVLTYNGSSWAPAAPTGGGGTDPIEDIFGTPDTAFEFNANSFTGLTAHGTADTESMHTTVPGHLLLGDDDGSQVGRWAAVTPACTMIVKLTDFVSFYNYQYVGVFVGVNPPGKMVFLGLQGGASPSIVMRTFSGPTDGSPGTPSPILLRAPLDSQGFAPWYFGIRAASSTDISYYISRSGVVWQPILLNHNNSMTAGSMGVTLSNYAGDGVKAQGAYDYIRIWNSAKTFPAFS